MRSRGLLVGIGVAAWMMAAVCAYAAPGQAQGGHGDGVAWFANWDANGDGKIERAEFQGPDAAFTRLDANGDGFITQDEVGAVQAHAPAAGGLTGQGGQFGQRLGQGAQGPMDPAARWQQMLQRFDANKDGQIAADEFQGPAEMFTRLDRDGDGILVETELARPQGGQGGQFRQGAQGPMDPAARWQQMLQRFDANKDGQIGADEFQGPPELFTRLDRDGNGILVETELARPEAGQRLGQAGQGAGQAGPAGGALNFERMLQNLDKDRDGKISREEWAGAAETFDNLDPDGNGFITAEDIEHLRQQQPQQQQQRANPAQIFIRMLDKDGDSQVSNGEWSDFFTVADTDSDGFVGQDELITVIQQALRPPQPAAQ